MHSFKRKDFIKEGDVIVITGGSRGLGLEIAKAILDAYQFNVKIAILDIVEPETMSDGLMFYYCDVTDHDALVTVSELIVSQCGRSPSILINNAGIRRPLATIAEADVKDTTDTLAVNLGGTMMSTRVFLPAIITDSRGFIVTIASALSMISPAGMASYGASKAGLLGFHESLTQELKDYRDIHTLLVCPGQLDTDMFSDVETPSQHFAPVVKSEDLARKILKCVSKIKTKTLFLPKYVKLLPYFRGLPIPVAKCVRKISGVDRVFENHAAAISENSLRNEEDADNVQLTTITDSASEVKDPAASKSEAPGDSFTTSPSPSLGSNRVITETSREANTEDLPSEVI